MFKIFSILLNEEWDEVYGLYKNEVYSDKVHELNDIPGERFSGLDKFWPTKENLRGFISPVAKTPALPQGGIWIKILGLDILPPWGKTSSSRIFSPGMLYNPYTHIPIVSFLVLVRTPSLPQGGIFLDMMRSDTICMGIWVIPIGYRCEYLYGYKGCTTFQGKRFLGC